MRKLEKLMILDVIIMAFSGIVAYVLNYVDMYDDRYSGLSSSLGWFVVFWIIFLISASILALALSIIIINKAIQNMKIIKKIAILDGIIMIISWGLMHILGYVGINSRTEYAGLYLKGGWDIFFKVIFLMTLIVFALTLCIIIMHKIISKIIQIYCKKYIK